jgi:hypothetical protein
MLAIEMRYLIGIDTKLADELRKYALKKHGVLFGTIKLETENAIREHLKGAK